MTEQSSVPDTSEAGDSAIPGLHRLRLDILLQELVDRAQAMIGVERKLHRLLDAVVAVASDLSLPDTLRRITELAAELADAEFAALGVIGPDLKLSQFITVGIDPHRRALIGDLPSGKGILGLLITHQETLRLPDLRQHPASFGFPAHHPPMGTFLGVPLRVRNEIFGNLYLTEKRGGGEFTNQDEDLIVALAAAAGIAIENARLYDEARRRERWLAASTEVTALLLRGAESAETMQLVVDKAGGIAEADATFLMLRDDSDQANRLIVLAAHGEGVEEFIGHTYTVSGTLAGEVFKEAAPRPFTDETTPFEAVSDRAPTVHFRGPGVMVPLSAGGQVIGVLSVVRHHGAAPFGPADVRMVHTFAGHAALVAEFSRVSADRQRLAIFEDRDRIARDLHDLIIQRLFATGLGLQALMPRAQPPDVGRKISGYVDDLDTTIHDVRRTIFSLQEPEERPSGLRGEILRTVTAASAALEFEPQLTMRGPLDSTVPPTLRPDLIAVLSEGLTNVVRHAAAKHTDIQVAVDTGARNITLVIEDDGVGPPQNLRAGHGTPNMNARAKRLGGSFTLEPRPDGGTRLTWSVPLDEPA